MQRRQATLQETQDIDNKAIIKSNTDKQAVNRIRHIAREQFEMAPGSHDWQHTLRVLSLCRRIGQHEGADMITLEAAAYLHDIGRAIPVQKSEGRPMCHALRGSQMAETILIPLSLSTARKKNIIHCVRTHRFRGNQAPESLEARVLFDADKLDAIGAVGIARAYLFAGELGACLHNPELPPDQAVAYSRDDTGHREYAVKLSKIKDRMQTAQGRKMAQARHAFMETFFERFFSEYEGAC